MKLLIALLLFVVPLVLNVLEQQRKRNAAAPPKPKRRDRDSDGEAFETEFETPEKPPARQPRSALEEWLENVRREAEGEAVPADRRPAPEAAPEPVATDAFSGEKNRSEGRQKRPSQREESARRREESSRRDDAHRRPRIAEGENKHRRPAKTPEEAREHRRRAALSDDLAMEIEEAERRDRGGSRASEEAPRARRATRAHLESGKRSSAPKAERVGRGGKFTVNARELRKAIILNELLSKPVGLRENPSE